MIHLTGIITPNHQLDPQSRTWLCILLNLSIASQSNRLRRREKLEVILVAFLSLSAPRQGKTIFCILLVSSDFLLKQIYFHLLSTSENTWHHGKKLNYSQLLCILFYVIMYLYSNFNRPNIHYVAHITYAWASCNRSEFVSRKQCS